MSRYIDADALNECMSIVQKANADSVEFNKRCRATDVFLDIWGLIKAQPTADVIEVVRCKDCRKWGNPNLCPFGKRYMPLGDGYCHAGERRWDGKVH